MRLAEIIGFSPPARGDTRVATVTLPPESAAPLQGQDSAPTVVRIEPTHGWLELRLADVWEYRELLYFFAMRDIRIRYKQTAVGVCSRL